MTHPHKEKCSCPYNYEVNGLDPACPVHCPQTTFAEKKVEWGRFVDYKSMVLMDGEPLTVKTLKAFLLTTIEEAIQEGDNLAAIRCADHEEAARKEERERIIKDLKKRHEAAGVNCPKHPTGKFGCPSCSHTKRKKVGLGIVLAELKEAALNNPQEG